MSRTVPRLKAEACQCEPGYCRVALGSIPQNHCVNYLARQGKVATAWCSKHRAHTWHRNNQCLKCTRTVMKTSNEIMSGLGQFTGTEHWYKIAPNLVMTDGVKWLCDNADCRWLVDAIASYQPAAMKHRGLRDAQFWTIRKAKPAEQDKVSGEPAAILFCDTGAEKAKPVITQNIPTTDFPLDNLKLYCMPGGPGGEWVILLPSEY